MTVLVHTPQQLADALGTGPRATGTVAFVPTMGALHDGHVQLMKHGRPLADTLVASIFVNPTQFGPGEDFGSYPRTLDADVERCADAGVDVVFAPDVVTMYPELPEGVAGERPVGVMVEPGPLGAILEGAQRPTHFRGVLTAVAKLFGLVMPDVAVFGEKDYQQLTLVRQMVRTLCMGVEIVGCPTVREPDGLAMSSRNAYLSERERELAAVIYQALEAGVAGAELGARQVVANVTRVLYKRAITPDYVVLASPDLGEPVPGEEARLLVAARVGAPRLIDNIALTLGA